jgi:hypothetical protein
LLVYCAGGYRSSVAASLLQRSEFPSVAEIAGGFAAWEAANLPVVTPVGMMIRALFRRLRLLEGGLRRGKLLTLPALALLLASARAQTPQQIIRQIVDTERAVNQSDHSQWVLLDHSTKPKEQVLQWIGTTPQGNVYRVLVKDRRQQSEPEQQAGIQKFLGDTRAQKKQVAAKAHELKQINTILGLLPDGFIWTVVKTTPDETTLHFVPNPSFKPPTREAHVLTAATGDLVADNHQHRIRRANGHLMHDVTFGGGFLGRIKQGGSFAIEQKQVAPSLWQLTMLRVHLDGKALLFKSLNFQEDDDRSLFTKQPDNSTLDQAAQAVMQQSGSPQQ